MSEKICFVHLENILAIPYLHKYTELTNTAFDIIYWNRRGLDENCGAENYYVMQYVVGDGTSKVKKLFGYIRFYTFASRILRKNRYEKVVLLTGNVAVLLKNTLLKYYDKKYIIDIRDYFLENNRYYYEAEKKLIDRSALAVISSEGYKTFLPEHDYLLVHNTPNLSEYAINQFKLEHEQWRNSKNENSPIVLSFIGGVRFLEQDKKVLRFFANDDRFYVRYIGAGADQLRPFCEEIGMKNVYLLDRFSPEETLDFYLETDMVLNLYGNGTPLLDYALSNKLYYAATLNLPILVCPDTFMEKVSGQYGFGFAVELGTPACLDRLYSWYRSIDWDSFNNGCRNFMDIVRRDNKRFGDEVSAWLSKM